jgi:glutathione gamma-glutamylcysteinyltransferase
MLIASYCRSALGQTGAGHYSPIGGYHAGSDQLLLLDVARFKYPPHWVPVSLMYEAMRDRDPATGRPRGWLVLSKRPTSSAVARFLVCSDGLATGGLVERALALSAEGLGTLPNASLEDVFQVTARALVESGLTESVRLRPPESDEHRASYAELEESFTRLPLYARAAAGLRADSAAAVTLWWLALAPVARRVLSSAVEAELAPLLDGEVLPAPLAAEIELLRSQVEFLLQRPGTGRVA